MEISLILGWSLVFGVGLVGLGSVVVWVHEGLAWRLIQAGTAVIAAWTVIVLVIASTAFLTI